MRTIKEIEAGTDYYLTAVFDTGEKRRFDVKPLFEMEVFSSLKDFSYFKQVANRGYFIEWPQEQDLSADTIYLEGQPA
ncbi:MAG: hypothetical protein A2268_11885 [Candidatus Raymondbacteria bacterium RifOxyA12_full_50_37]|uniref:DUF2442 domain-containing protein n=1 Tax=Candidatus Raymondbacteria bacterium RIFOXYD12_FULL_49_13 TaxID=1817890 RepID=A0A1F7FK66_UNCRA|nr:MAG: hypothetical protein A2268_11885 [Candidatus Raymondbacteria bacterium RifOxyA12_full_50_37]OGJ91721.1 MAG: hypothetical protein A2248_13770 [Candidatus Raymondbacteria bacterium RIFOXYA2_FULL_49_16]OGK03932.1 MAG: hypothetical protein A2350_15040 [Candidatus Raymondbacteria bacterium RifOxyB12_full_50_8]OGK06971.1 MAG: hypothetical protein A2519_17355 [Candidatus Raymondbacteria bacterium RIFOXYD12_FULL_49_13]OGP43912.1 MAG: hypothetical protein A2324_00375 [Candidatus Raymondbacteria 